MPYLPFVSIIVPVLNGERTLKNCLTSVRHVDYPHQNLEVIVVDNGSTDGTPDILKSFPVKSLRDPHRGAARARNKGIESSVGDVLAFIDADCVVTSGWVRELVRGFEDRSVHAVEGQIVAYPPRTPIEKYHARIGSHSRNQRLARGHRYFMLTANVAFRREVFSRIGLFDTGFPSASGEDVDFSWRYFTDQKLGYSFAPKAIVFHSHRTTPRELYKQRFSNGYAWALLHKKYPDKELWNWRQEVEFQNRMLRTGWAYVRTFTHSSCFSNKQNDRKDVFYHFWSTLAYRMGFHWGIISSLVYRRYH